MAEPQSTAEDLLPAAAEEAQPAKVNDGALLHSHLSPITIKFFYLQWHHALPTIPCDIHHIVGGANKQEVYREDMELIFIFRYKKIHRI